MTQNVRLTRFDAMVALVMAALVLAIGVTILLGDRVGVQIDRYGPAGMASTTPRVFLTFSDVMNWETVTERLRFEPELDGDYRWNNRTLYFTPAVPLPPGSAYTVTLEAGAESTGQRAVLDDIHFDFEVRRPRVAYLTPADSVPQNIWIAEPGVEGSAEQLTFSSGGVLNFDASPDGTMIAFAERNDYGTSDIKLLNLETGAIEQITNCVDSDCNTPVWRPDGTMILYHRIDLNSDIGSVGVSPTRVWVIDLTTTPPTNRPLFSDSQILGFAPQWSADGSRVALFDNSNRAILVYDLTDESISMIPSQNGGSDVAFAPDGTKVVFPRLIFEDGGGVRSILQLADLETGDITNLVDPDASVDDAQTAWNPDGERLAVARRFTDERETRTRQIYLMDGETGEAEPLVVDERYFNGFFSWDPQGSQLVIQRFPELTAEGNQNAEARPEVWTYEMSSGTLVPVAENAYLPRWVP